MKKTLKKSLSIALSLVLLSSGIASIAQGVSGEALLQSSQPKAKMFKSAGTDWSPWQNYPNADQEFALRYRFTRDGGLDYDKIKGEPWGLEVEIRNIADHTTSIKVDGGAFKIDPSYHVNTKNGQWGNCVELDGDPRNTDITVDELLYVISRQELIAFNPPLNIASTCAALAGTPYKQVQTWFTPYNFITERTDSFTPNQTRSYRGEVTLGSVGFYQFDFAAVRADIENATPFVGAMLYKITAPETPRLTVGKLAQDKSGNYIPSAEADPDQWVKFKIRVANQADGTAHNAFVTDSFASVEELTAWRDHGTALTSDNYLTGEYKLGYYGDQGQYIEETLNPASPHVDQMVDLDEDGTLETIYFKKGDLSGNFSKEVFLLAKLKGTEVFKGKTYVNNTVALASDETDPATAEANVYVVVDLPGAPPLDEQEKNPGQLEPVVYPVKPPVFPVEPPVRPKPPVVPPKVPNEINAEYDVHLLKTESDSDETKVQEMTSKAGEKISYTVTFKNNGNTKLTNLTLTDDYDERYLMNVKLPATEKDYYDTGKALIWKITEFPANQTITKTIEAQIKTSLPPQDIYIFNVAELKSKDQPIDLVSVTSAFVAANIPAVGSPYLVVDKSVSDLNGGNTEPGDALRYTIAIANLGNADSLDNVVTDDMPLYTQGFKITSLPTGAKDRSGASGGANGTGKLDLTIPTIKAGETATIVYELTIASTIPDGFILPNIGTVNAAGAVRGESQVATKIGEPAPSSGTVAGAAANVPTGPGDFAWYILGTVLIGMAGLSFSKMALPLLV